MNIEDYLKFKRNQVEDGLKKYMVPSQEPLTPHIRAMRYSLTAGGKRVRPILCLAAAEALGCNMTHMMAIPVALECIHTYSLIHDDLPAMDDDELRRGKPTNHIAFGEAEAILAGDGLLTFAFDLMSSASISEFIDCDNQLKLINLVAQAAGSLGMVGGQSLDIASENQDISIETLQTIHSLKTGALITVSVQCGAILGNATKEQFNCLTEYGRNIGLAFQIVDDLLNVEGDEAKLGKAVGSDAEQNKATYPGFFGIPKTREKAKQAVDKSIEALSTFDENSDPLRDLANYIYQRTN